MNKSSISVRRFLPGDFVDEERVSFSEVEVIERSLRLSEDGESTTCRYKNHPCNRVFKDSAGSLFIADPREFSLGDRVMLASASAHDAYAGMRNGIVVPYKGKHDPFYPRVRWASGWATSCRASELRIMSSSEEQTFAKPNLTDVDHTPLAVKFAMTCLKDEPT